MLQKKQFDCQDCLEANPGEANQVRAVFHCGFMDRALWVGDEPAVGRFGGERVGANMCPGYLVRLESVVDACRAHLWFRKGQLEVAEPNPPRRVIEACETAERAWNLYEAAQTNPQG